MRWLYLTVIVVFVAVIAIFVVQNLEVVTMAFLGFSIRAPLAILAVVVYILGAATGGTLYALLRKSRPPGRACRAALWTPNSSASCSRRSTP